MKEKFIVGIIFPFINNIFILFTNYLLYLRISVDIIGDWVFLNSLIGIGFILTDLGIDSIHYQYSAKKNFKYYFGSYLILRISLLIINSIITVSLSVLYGIWNLYFFLGFSFLLVSQISLYIRNILLVNLRSKSKFIKSDLALFFYTILKNILILSLVFNLSVIGNPIIYLSLFYLLSEVFIIIILTFLSKNEIFISKPKKNIILEYFKDVKPLVIFAITFTVTQNVGNLIIYYYFGKTQLAIFNLAYTLTFSVLSSLSITIKPIYYSVYSKFFKENKIHLIKTTTFTIVKFSSIFFLSIIIIIYLNGELIFRLLLPNYVKSTQILLILIFVPYFYGIARPYQLMLIPGRKQTQSVIIDTSLEIFTLILIAISITSGLGILGYSLALLIPRILYVLFSQYYTKKFFKIGLQRFILFHILIAFFTLLLSYLIKYYVLINLFSNDFILFLASSFISLGIFFTFLYSSKNLVKEDILFIRNLFKIKNYIESLRNEFY